MLLYACVASAGAGFCSWRVRTWTNGCSGLRISGVVHRADSFEPWQHGELAPLVLSFARHGSKEFVCGRAEASPCSSRSLRHVREVRLG